MIADTDLKISTLQELAETFERENIVLSEGDLVEVMRHWKIIQSMASSFCDQTHSATDLKSDYE